MTDLTIAPGFFDYVMAYEAQGMSKEAAIDKAHTRFFGTVECSPQAGQRSIEPTPRPSRPAIPAEWETNGENYITKT